MPDLRDIRYHLLNRNDMNDYTAPYRDWTIVVDHERREYMAYPTSQGPQHDADLVGESYQYCGNCLWNSDEDGLKADIDDEIIQEQDRQIDRLKAAIIESNDALQHAQSVVTEFMTHSEIIEDAMTKNNEALKYCES